MSGATAVAGTASLVGVQWLGEGGMVAAGVTMLGAIAAFFVSINRQQSAAFKTQVDAQAIAFQTAQAAQAAAFAAAQTASVAELVAARQRITELEHRVDELSAMLLRSGVIPAPPS